MKKEITFSVSFNFEINWKPYLNGLLDRKTLILAEHSGSDEGNTS